MIHARRAETHTQWHAQRSHRPTHTRATGPQGTRPLHHTFTRRRTRGAADLSTPHKITGQIPARSDSAHRQPISSFHLGSASTVHRTPLSLARPRPLPPRGSSREAEHTHTHINTHNGVPGSNRLSRTRQPIPFNSRGGGGAVRRGGALCDGTALSARVSRG